MGPTQFECELVRTALVNGLSLASQDLMGTPDMSGEGYAALIRALESDKALLVLDALSGLACSEQSSDLSSNLAGGLRPAGQGSTRPPLVAAGRAASVGRAAIAEYSAQPRVGARQVSQPPPGRDLSSSR